MTDISPVVTLPLRGRDIKLDPPDLGQLALLQHQARIMARDDVTREQGVRALDLAYRIVRSTLADEESRDYVNDLIADKEITIVELVQAMMEAVKKQNEEAEEKTPAVRRGRPRKKA